MGNPRAAVRQADVKRAIKAVLAAGLKPSSVLAGPNGVRVYFGQDDDTHHINSWDRVLTDDPSK